MKEVEKRVTPGDSDVYGGMEALLVPNFCTIWHLVNNAGKFLDRDFGTDSKDRPCVGHETALVSCYASSIL